MIFQDDTIQMCIPFDETQCHAQRNYQGSFGTLFCRNYESGSSASIAIMLYPNNSLPMQQIYLNTVTELRRMLIDFAIISKTLGADICEFEYEGTVQNQRMSFFQRILRSDIICSITGGCPAEFAQDQIPQIKQIPEQITILKGEQVYEE